LSFSFRARGYDYGLSVSIIVSSNSQFKPQSEWDSNPRSLAYICWVPFLLKRPFPVPLSRGS
jgi:hypothetical protein